MAPCLLAKTASSAIEPSRPQIEEVAVPGTPHTPYPGSPVVFPKTTTGLFFLQKPFI